MTADEVYPTIKRLNEEIENLKSVMIAAAEEIQAHWQAHCDKEGYGPANLMHRLEKGIPANYNYKAGDFEKLTKRLENLEYYAKNLHASTHNMIGILENKQWDRLPNALWNLKDANSKMPL